MLQPKNVGQALKKRSFLFNIAALTAGSDVADVPLMRMPFTGQIIGVNVIPQGDDAGIDADNTSAWLIENGSTSLASKTYNGTVTFPDKGVVGDLTLSTTEANLKLAEGTVLTYSITNGATAATPASVIEIEALISDAAQFDTVHAATSAT